MADDHADLVREKASLPNLLGGLMGTEKQFLSGKRDRGADLESAVKIFLEFLHGFEFFGHRCQQRITRNVLMATLNGKPRERSEYSRVGNNFVTIEPDTGLTRIERQV